MKICTKALQFCQVHFQQLKCSKRAKFCQIRSHCLFSNWSSRVDQVKFLYIRNHQGHFEQSCRSHLLLSLGMELISSRRWRLDQPKQKAVVFMLKLKNLCNTCMAYFHSVWLLFISFYLRAPCTWTPHSPQWSANSAVGYVNPEIENFPTLCRNATVHCGICTTVNKALRGFYGHW